jgi:glycerol uptake facilitator-like aquaporin
MPNLSRRLAAEFIGTAFLLMAVVGSGIMAERLADGNVALALLCNAIATGAMLVVLIAMLGPVSGAHFNPAVTLAFWLRRELHPHGAMLYVIAQIAGGVLGVWLVHMMFDMPVLQTGIIERAGAGQWLAEAVAAFGLVFTVLTTIRARPEAVAMAVGLYIASAYWFTASTSFANPAVTIARSLTNSFSGIRPLDAPMFILMQLIGAILAWAVCRWLLAEKAGA